MLCDTRLSPSKEGAFRKLWGETCHFNSHSSDKHGIAVLIRDGTPIDNIKFQNIIRGNFSKLTFNVKNESVLVKCIYAPNTDMNLTSPDNEGKIFFQKVFEDTNENNYTHKITLGDFNVCHTYDTSGYLHINNPNSRDYLARNIAKCNLVDIWRDKNPKNRQYTFGKKQTKTLLGPAWIIF